MGRSFTGGGPVSCPCHPVGRWWGSPHPNRPVDRPKLIARAIEISPVPMFLVIRLRSGPDYDAQRPLEQQSGWDEHAAFMDGLVGDGVVVLGGPLVDEHRVALAIQADSEAAVNATLERDPWTGSHLVTDSVERWTIRLAGRARRYPAAAVQSPGVSGSDSTACHVAGSVSPVAGSPRDAWNPASVC